MIETKLDIINKLGLHARAAAKVVSVASRYESRIHVIHNGKPIDAKSIMGLLMLAASRGASIELETNGPEAESLADALEELVNNRFGEEC